MSQIGVISLGCAKNQVDTEHMLAYLKAAGHDFVSDPSEADILIVNTCGFIEPAKQESINTILEMAEYKKHGRCSVLVATGCLAQRYGSEVMKELYELVAKDKGRCQLFCPVSAYTFQKSGIANYAEWLGVTKGEATRKLLELAREVKADGILMECVDYRNYTPEMSEALR